MIDLKNAEYLVGKKLKELELRSNIKLAILKEATIEFQYGWMFFYQSQEYVKTGNLDFIVGGNSPMIVDKFNSSMHFTGTRRGAEFYIDMYCKFRDDINTFYEEVQ